MSPQDRRDRGSILLVAVVLVIIVVGLSGAYLVMSDVLGRRVTEGSGAIDARAAAEEGVDFARGRLLALVDTQSEDRTAAWSGVLDDEDGVPPWADGVPTRQGSYTIRVLDNDDGDGNPYDDSDETLLLEATGYGTPRGAEGPAHVIRCAVTLEVNDPTAKYAILTNDDLHVYGAMLVDGTLGRIHSDQDLTVQGATTISRSATASGSISTVGDAYAIGGEFLPDRPIIPIKPVQPSDYRPFADFILTADGRVLEGSTGRVLFDAGAAAGPGPRGGGGGTHNGFTWDARQGWSTVTSGWVDGTYYVEGSLTMNHGGEAARPWRVTIVTEGSVSMQGNPYLAPYLNGAELLVAGGDIYARGTGSNAQVEGLILAHEQVDLSGNITIHGRVVAESAVNTAGSPVADNANPLLVECGGGVHVEYNDRIYRSLSTEFRLPVRSWQEELPTNVAPFSD
ncbi:MAG: hypothetical protein AAB434_01135 [Planctomycetota bacterium]